VGRREVLRAGDQVAHADRNERAKRYLKGPCSTRDADVVSAGTVDVDGIPAEADGVGERLGASPRLILGGHLVLANGGEAAGTLAAFTLEAGRNAADVHGDPALLRALQRRLVAAGVPLYWFVDVPVDDPRFAEIQMAAVSGDIIGAPDSLEAAAAKRR